MKRLWRVIKETIGVRSKTHTYNTFRNLRPWSETRDMTRPDYEFWDKARECTGAVEGLEISGLLIKPLVSKVAGWTMGQLPQIKSDNERLQERLNEWAHKNHATLIKLTEESAALGDYFVVVNPDLSLTMISPDVVDPLVDEDDYSQIAGWRTIERFDDPLQFGRYMIETNIYTPDQRVRDVEFNDRPPQREVFTNLIDRARCVHVPNNRRSNSVFGKPEAAPLATSNKGLLHMYGEVLSAGADGNIRQGRSTPVMEHNTVQEMTAFRDAYGKTVVDPNTGEKSFYIDFDGDKLVQMAGGTFRYEQPGAFIDETIKLLEVLYWLVLEHTELPEFVMGTAISSSRASAETQMPIFVKWVEKKQGETEGWLMDLLSVVAQLLVLTEPGIGDYSELAVEWPAMTDKDGNLMLETVKWAFAEGLLPDELAVELLTILDIEDPASVVQEARAERMDRMELAMDRIQTRAINAPDDEDVVNGQLEAVN